MLKSRLAPAIAMLLLLSGCSGPKAPAASTPEPPRQEAAASFVNQVWKVSRSSGVEPGMLYVFLSDGTLVITSPHAKPAFGTWRSEDGALTMVEESIPYKVEILKLSQAEFSIRIHSPGEPLEITFVPADRPQTS
ncbi:MAG TPA: hypothetical protein VLB76_10920 [Thermoanaerobaculia bacterium]|jgi:hypothetical protein|nr:hypothetical protein [Thermoanaerobaculia bacterium]